MAKAMYIVVKVMGGHLQNFYKTTDFAGCRIWTGKTEEAARLPWDKALKFEDDRTFAIKETELEKWLADPPKKALEAIARQQAQKPNPGKAPYR